MKDKMKTLLSYGCQIQNGLVHVDPFLNLVFLYNDIPKLQLIYMEKGIFILWFYLCKKTPHDENL